MKKEFTIMYRITFLLFMGFSAFHGIAQNTLLDDLNGVYYDPTLYMQRYAVEEGSPYLDLNFKPAKIGDRDKNYLVRFNAYEGSVEVYIRANKVVELMVKGQERIKMLDGSKREYVVTQFKNQKDKMVNGFLEEIQTTKNFSLFLRERIQFLKKKKAEGYAAAKPARFEKDNDEFYLELQGEGALIFLPTNKKKFLQVFSPKIASKAKDFIKKERLNVSKKEDIQLILAHIYGE